jgi:lysophospholipase L1-like esterase
MGVTHATQVAPVSGAAYPAHRRRVHSLLSGLAISAVTLALCLAAVEAFGYVWEEKTAEGPLGWTLVGARRLRLERHGTAAQPYYTFKPNEDYQWGGIPVHINSAGFRTEAFATPKPADTVRVLNLGDSVAFGWQVRQEETYGKQLEQLLNARGDGKHYEVINAGTPGWGTEDERNFLLQQGLTYEPDVVLLDITLVNDIYGGVAEAGRAEEPGPTTWLREHSYIWPMLTTQGRLLFSKQKGPEAIPVLNPPRDPAAYFPLSETDPHWDSWWRSVATMQAALQPRGIKLVLVPFPTAFQFARDNPHPAVPQRVLRQRAVAANIELVDPLPLYQQACRSAGPDACEGFVNLLSVDVWMHPSPLGHRLAAEALRGL